MIITFNTCIILISVRRWQDVDDEEDEDEYGNAVKQSAVAVPRPPITLFQRPGKAEDGPGEALLTLADLVDFTAQISAAGLDVTTVLNLFNNVGACVTFNPGLLSQIRQLIDSLQVLTVPQMIELST